MQDVVLHCIKVRKHENKPIFCDQTQGRNTGNARIESESILVLCCVVTRVDAMQRDVLCRVVIQALVHVPFQTAISRVRQLEVLAAARNRVKAKEKTANEATSRL